MLTEFDLRNRSFDKVKAEIDRLFTIMESIEAWKYSEEEDGFVFEDEEYILED